MGIHLRLLTEVLSCTTHNRVRAVSPYIRVVDDIICEYLEEPTKANANLSCNWCDRTVYRYDFNPHDTTSWSTYCHHDSWGNDQVKAYVAVSRHGNVIHEKTIHGHDYPTGRECRFIGNKYTIAYSRGGAVE